MCWSSLQTEKVQGDTSSKLGESAKVTGARLVSARPARKRQRKIASRSCVRLGDEEQSVVGTLESTVADSECPGTLESPVVDSECPLRSGLVWRWMENDSEENVSEWTVDDFGERITDEVDEAKRFKQVKAWGGVHMCQSSQERPGGRCDCSSDGECSRRNGKAGKERNLWESDGGSEAKSSAEEQFEVIDKAALMAEHRKELGNKYIDMMVNMDAKDIEAKLTEFRAVTEGTDDQKTLAMLSLMWMVERRKEEQREEQGEKELEEVEQREVQREKEREEAEHKQGDWEREGDRIMEAEERHEEKEKELEEDKWEKWEDWEGNEIVEAIRRHERREEEMERVEEEEKMERVEKMVAEIVEVGVVCMRQWEEEKECSG